MNYYVEYIPDGISPQMLAAIVASGKHGALEEAGVFGKTGYIEDFDTENPEVEWVVSFKVSLKAVHESEYARFVFPFGTHMPTDNTGRILYIEAYVEQRRLPTRRVWF